jgi:hypothetical protein
MVRIILVTGKGKFEQDDRENQHQGSHKPHEARGKVGGGVKLLHQLAAFPAGVAVDPDDAVSDA